MTNDSGDKPADGAGSADLAEQAKQRAAELAEQAKQRFGELKEKAGPLADQAKGKASELAEKAGPAASQAKEKAAAAAEKAGDVAATGVVAAAGGLDKVTGGRWSDKIKSVSEKVTHVLDPDHSTKPHDPPAASTTPTPESGPTP